MQNLLPSEEKKKILVSYRVRLAIIAVFTIASLVVAGFVLLVPSYLFAVSRYNVTMHDLKRLESRESNSVYEKAIDTEVRNTNKKIDLFLKDRMNKWILPSEITKKIINAKGDGVRIFSLAYDLSAGKERVVITGIASDRNSLSLFIETLKKDKIFTKVEIPISSYVKSTNINFSAVASHEVVSEVKKK